MLNTNWALDPTHSEVQFKVKHLVISTVTGYFKKFSATLQSNEENFDGAKANFEAEIQSIDTNNSDRDNHLKSDDFFNAENFPKLTFENGVFEKINEEDFTINGDITIRDVTKPISLKATYGGSMVDPYGNHKVGFEISGKLNRKDFNLNWSAVTEAGGVVVGDEVKLLLNLQFIKQ